MQRSKSWLKSLLIVVLAIVLVFSLVACNKDKNKDYSAVEESTADYFNALWNSTKAIGAKSVGNTDDLAVSFGLEVSIDTFEEKSNSIYQQIDLGLDVQAVIARTAATAGKTAAKIRLYDPSDANHTEILTLYAFANDLDNLYIDFAGKNIRLPHNLETAILGEAGAAGKGIVDFLTNHKVTIGGQEKSINDIINIFASKFGSNWSLNSIVDSILTLVGYSVDDILDMLKNGIPGMDGTAGLDVVIANFFQVDSIEDLLDSNGNIDILKILTSDFLSGLLQATRERVNGVTTHKANLNGLLSMALGFLPNNAGDTIAEILYPESNPEKGGELSLWFSEKDGAIQDFTIFAKLLGLKTETEDYVLVPEISVKITEFGIEALSNDNGVALKTDKSNYSDTIAFDETIELAASGIQILGEEDDNISLNGKIVVNAKGQLDIVNTKAVIAANEAITENKTKANITVTLYNRNDAPVEIAKISYANGKIAGKFADGIDFGFINKELEGKSGFVYDLGADFNIADIVQNFITGMFGGEQSVNATTSAADIIDAPLLTLAEKIHGVLDVALRMVTTPNNHLHIETSNILATIVDFKEAVNPGSGTVANPGPDKWTEANRIDAIVNSLINPEYADKSVDECLDILKEQLDRLKDLEDIDEEEIADTCKDIAGICKNVAFRLLYIVGPNVRLTGVQTTELKASDYAAYKQNGEAITAEDTDLMIYINNIKAVLATQITIDGDLQDGIHSSINIKIAGATLSASTSFELVENATFTDVYQEYVAASEADKTAKWAYFTSNEQE